MSHGLFIDTSIRGLQMAFMANSAAQPEVVWQTIVPDNPGSSGQIGALFKQGLNHVGIDAFGLTSVLVGSGPGSFTGIKIGLSFAYGLVRARAGKLPCHGLSSLELIGKQLANEESRPVQMALAATQSQGFLFRGDASGGQTTVVAMTQSPADMGLDQGLSVDFLAGWPVFTQNLEKAGIHARVVPEARWRVLLFDAMLAEYAGKAGMNKAQPNAVVLPEPNFMRYAAPVEKQMQKTGELKL